MSETEPRLDLRPDHWAIVRDVLRRHVPDRKVLAFGSRANWTAKEYSDLDLAILGGEPLSLDIESALVEDFGESDLPFKVDIVDWAKTDRVFRQTIGTNAVEVQAPHGDLASVKQLASVERVDWQTATIEEISEKVAMGPFGSSIKVETFVPKGVPIISGQHLRGTRVDDSAGYNFISEAHATRLANANVQRGDIIFTHAGNIGQAAYVPEGSQYSQYVISQRQFFMRCDSSKAIPEFVTAYFKSPEGQHKLLANASQVGVPSIAQPVTYLRTIEIPLPPLLEQRAIARILGTLDDKIELNQRMNETLEAMARAIFKDWFVDFGPVRAKMEGKIPYLPADIWDMFPDRLADKDEPAGWKRYRLSELVCHHRDTVAPSADPDRIFEHYSIPAYGAWGEPTFDLGESIKSSKTVVPDGTVLLSKLNPNIERVWLPNRRSDAPQVASTEFLAFTALRPATRNILFCLFKSGGFRNEMGAMVTGTSRSHQRVSPMALLAREVLVAEPRLLEAFDRAVCPLITQMLAKRSEIRILVRTRDLLLPKLMSGDMRIHDSEQLLGDLL